MNGPTRRDFLSVVCGTSLVVTLPGCLDILADEDRQLLFVQMMNYRDETQQLCLRISQNETVVFERVYRVHPADVDEELPGTASPNHYMIDPDLGDQPGDYLVEARYPHNDQWTSLELSDVESSHVGPVVQMFGGFSFPDIYYYEFEEDLPSEEAPSGASGSGPYTLEQGKSFREDQLDDQADRDYEVETDNVCN
ncbi:hypothetical protein [Natranaeroarchaeum aerophilus]|uniref:Uncharacterized protein n=1 Tax=Natranaeroarchaeum aerophilus TaxID=2917711 RepID=A0AAE3K6U7_9EURY|nr:hypothetical protein [Natranaeroarchaeum aerophilus]MCL9815306.1 hypothetical protein [Natranaeroarchaeum aerophilus]